MGVINTAVCWEIRGTFSIEFAPGTDLFLFGQLDGVRVDELHVHFEKLVTVRQPYQQPLLKIYVNSIPVPLEFHHEHIVAIYDEEGIVWR